MSDDPEFRTEAQVTQLHSSAHVLHFYQRETPQLIYHIT